MDNVSLGPSTHPIKQVLLDKVEPKKHTIKSKIQKECLKLPLGDFAFCNLGAA